RRQGGGVEGHLDGRTRGRDDGELLPAVHQGPARPGVARSGRATGVRVTILGCGTSGGVPRLGGKDGMGEWGAADPADARNRRTRCSILVEDQGKTVLVDTSPDVRAQLLDARVEKVDAVIWSHEHADQVHGIDDLRPYTFRRGAIEAWADARTLQILQQRFGYIFESGGDGLYHALYDVRTIDGPFIAAGTIAVTPIPLDHGIAPSLGFRFGDIL